MTGAKGSLAMATPGLDAAGMQQIMQAQQSHTTWLEKLTESQVESQKQLVEFKKESEKQLAEKNMQLEERQTNIQEAFLGAIRSKFQEQDARFEQNEQRLRLNEQRAELQAKCIEQHTTMLNRQQAYVQDVAGEFDAKMGAVDAKVDAHVGAVDAKVGAVDSKVGAVDAKVGAVDAKVGAVDAKVADMQGAVESRMNLVQDSVTEAIGSMEQTVQERIDQSIEHAVQQLRPPTPPPPLPAPPRLLTSDDKYKCIAKAVLYNFRPHIEQSYYELAPIANKFIREDYNEINCKITPSVMKQWCKTKKFLKIIRQVAYEEDLVGFNWIPEKNCIVGKPIVT